MKLTVVSITVVQNYSSSHWQQLISAEHPRNRSAFRLVFTPSAIKTIMATAVVETDASTTHSVSCSECQRRKQKCSRLWPCQHCSSRGVSHLCRFGPRKASPVDETSKGESQSSRKRKEIEHNASLAPLASVASVAKGPAEFSPADGLRALGYLQIDDDPKFSGFATQKKEPSISAGHEASLRAIPPR